MAAEINASTPPPSGVTIIEGPPPPPPPKPTTEIRVSSLPGAVAPTPPPKPGSARSRMREALEKKAGIDHTPEVTPPATPGKTNEATPEANRPGEQPEPEGETNQPEGATNVPEDGTKTPEGETPPPAGKPGKVSPWKLFEAEKKARATAEQQLQELRSQILPEQERKVITERMERAEARAKELEEHIRFIDYSKHPEFQEKYQKPYEAAWARAMSDLKELTVVDTQGAARPITAEDMLELVQLPLGKAREIADQVFGKFANDVMEHRKEIKTLFEAQTNALAEARKNGTARAQQQMESVKKWREQATTEIRQIWQAANNEALADPNHGVYFQPKAGDEKWNASVTKGQNLVDKAFSIDPLNPKLSPADRAEAVRCHAAVRNRAIAYGPLRIENAGLKAELETVKKELAKYKGANPPAGGRNATPGAPAGPMKARDAVHAALQKLAH